MLQMTPSIEQQARAMLGLLRRYDWSNFAVLTGALSGHEFFVNTLRRLVDEASSG